MTALATPRPDRPPLSGAALLAVILGGAETLVLLGIRTVAAAINYVDGVDFTVLGNVLGALGVASLLWTAAVIVLGHLGARRSVLRGRVLAGVGLGLGYFHLALWGNRIALAVIAAAGAHRWQDWLGDVFVWS